MRVFLNHMSNQDCENCPFSRPFINLHKLEHDRLIEIYGLKDEQIHEYIDKNVDGPSRERVRSMLTGVPHLMSLCQITFYCMAFCRIFGEGDVDADELNTYTSIMAFVVLVSQLSFI